HRQGPQVRARGGAHAHRAQCPRTRAPWRAAAAIGQTRTEGVDRDMRHHTVTATFSAPPDEVFAYLANIDNLPNWATDFARELKLVDGRHKVVNGLCEFFFDIDADRESGVIDMLAAAREDALQLFRTQGVPVAEGG